MKKNNDTYWVGIVFGSIITLLLTFVLRSSVINNWKDYLFSTTIALVAVVAFFGFIFFFRRKIFKRILGIEQASSKEFMETIASAIRKFANGEKNSALDEMEGAAKMIVAIYSWLSLRNWVVTTVLTLSAAYIATIGTLLLFEQNEKISIQNDIMNSQKSFLEYQFLMLEQRRFDYYVSQIRDLSRELESPSPGSLAEDGNTIQPNYFTDHPVLSRKLSNRLGQLTGILTPYWALDSAKIGSNTSVNSEIVEIRKIKDIGARLVKLSKERGTLLQALLNNGFAAASFEIGSGDEENARPSGIFTSSDMRGARISPNYHEAIYKKYKILNELLDTKICAATDREDVRMIAPYYESKLVKGSSFAGAELFGISTEFNGGVDYGKAYLKDSYIQLTMEGLDQLSGLRRSYDNMFIVSRKMLGEMWPFIEKGASSTYDPDAAESQGRHFANCLGLDAKEFSASDGVVNNRVTDKQMLAKKLAQEISISLEKFNELFSVYQLPSDEIEVRRKDHAWG